MALARLLVKAVLGDVPTEATMSGNEVDDDWLATELEAVMDSVPELDATDLEETELEFWEAAGTFFGIKQASAPEIANVETEEVAVRVVEDQLVPATKGTKRGRGASSSAQSNVDQRLPFCI